MDHDIHHARATCLHDLHVRDGARMVPYAGVRLPLQYQGILAEHAAARNGAALFDTCHMGRFRIAGADGVAGLERLLTCRVATLAPGRCRYGLMLDENGGTLDDLVLYRLDDTSFLLVANADTRQQDFDWLRAHLPDSVSIEDETEARAKLDLQGPAAPQVAAAILDPFPRDLRYFGFHEVRFENETIWISRTGYTGEAGFELYLSHAAARRFWTAARDRGAVPAGLGARDTLRLEMGMPLQGQELTRQRCAAESGLDWAMDPGKDFIGCETLRDPARRNRRLVGLLGEGRSAARPGDAVWRKDRETGRITSGSFAPSLGRPAALAYVNREDAETGTALTVVGRRTLCMHVHPLPFYTAGSARNPMQFRQPTTRIEP